MNLDRFKKGATFMLSEKVVKMATQLGTMVLLARFLGPAELGTLMYCYALASLFMFLNNFGLNSLLVKWMVEDGDNTPQYLKHALVLRVIASLFSILLINVLGLWLVDDSNRLLLLVISLYHLLLPVSLVEWFFQARGRAELSAYGLMAGSIVGFIFRITFLLQGADLIWLGVAYSVELLAVLIVYAIIASKEKLSNTPISAEKIKQMTIEAFPLLLSGAVIMLYMRIDQLMLGYMVGETEVGIYSAATRLSEAWYFIGLTVLGVYFPKFLQIRKESGEAAYLNAIVRLGRIVIFAALGLAVITTFISDWLVELLYGNEYSESADVLTVSIWAVVFVYLGTISSQMFVADGRQALQLYRSVMALIINAVLNYVLIPQYGATGAAMALLIAQVFAGVLFNFLRNWNVVKVQLAIIYLYRVKVL